MLRDRSRSFALPALSSISAHWQYCRYFPTLLLFHIVLLLLVLNCNSVVQCRNIKSFYYSITELMYYWTRTHCCIWCRTGISAKRPSPATLPSATWRALLPEIQHNFDNGDDDDGNIDVNNDVDLYIIGRFCVSVCVSRKVTKFFLTKLFLSDIFCSNFCLSKFCSSNFFVQDYFLQICFQNLV